MLFAYTVWQRQLPYCIEPLRFWSGGRGGGEVPQKGKKAKNDYSAIADIFQYILVESLRNVKLGFKNRNLLFFN